MPRKPRIEYSGAYYHVMSRGDRQEAIFRDRADRVLFLETLEQACSRTGWKVHCYVLLDNHYHFLLETPEPNLVVGMQWFQSTYTKRFNVKHHECGHLFQGRYKSLLIDPDAEEYFKVVSTYIHLNPARAKQFDLEEGKLQEFLWSSYPAYLYRSRRPGWLTVQQVLDSHGFADDRSGRLAYQRYMQSCVGDIARSDQPHLTDPDWSKIRRGWCLGSESFRESLLMRLDKVRAGAKRTSHAGDEVREHNELQGKYLLSRSLKILDLRESDLWELPKGAIEKQILAWYIRRQTTVSNAWLSDALQCGHPSNIPGYIRRITTTRDKTTKRLVKKILKSED